MSYTEEVKNTRGKHSIVFENWLFESYLCESRFGWDVYQFEKTDNGYKLRLHMLAEEPVATVEDAKKRIEIWQYAEKIAPAEDGEQLMAEITELIKESSGGRVEAE